MKKMLHIALVLVYLPAALGVGFDIHYCEGAVESVKVFSMEDRGCCCGNEPSTGCCEDEREFVKLDENSQVAPQMSDFKTKVACMPLAVYTVVSSPLIAFSVNSYTQSVFSESGPPIYSAPSYLRFRTLLI